METSGRAEGAAPASATPRRPLHAGYEAKNDRYTFTSSLGVRASFLTPFAATTVRFSAKAS